MTRPVYALNLFNVRDKAEYIAYSRKNKSTLILGAGVLLLAAVIAAVAWLRLHESATPAFAPNRANDKRLVAGGWSGDELRKIVGDFAKLYHAQLPPDFSFEVRSDGALQIANFPHDLSPWLFCYLVNYAQYPKDLELKDRTILVAGTTTLSPDFALPAQALYGRKAVFYVPAGDAEYNNVYVRLAGPGVSVETWKIPFEGDAWEAVADPRLPAGLESITAP